MTDDLHKRGRQDRDRISLVEEWEVRRWCDKFQVTEARLREIVADVGDMVSDVQRFLEDDG